MAKTRKIILPQRTKMKTGAHGVIYIPKQYRELFPEYHVFFSLKTDEKTFNPWITARSKISPLGCNLYCKELKDWFVANKPSVDDAIVIEIIKPHKAYALSVLKRNEEFLENLDSDLITMTEGGERVVISVQAERNPMLRKEAIKFHGTACKVCGFDFENKYGDWGKGFIEVHHLLPFGQSKKIKREVNIKKDLTVLCSNCHKMIHRKKEMTLTVQELKSKLKEII